MKNKFLFIDLQLLSNLILNFVYFISIFILFLSIIFHITIYIYTYIYSFTMHNFVKQYKYSVSNISIKKITNIFNE